MRNIAGGVALPSGTVLPYTITSTMEQAEEEASKRWGVKLWEALKQQGYKVVQVEITNLIRNESL